MFYTAVGRAVEERSGPMTSPMMDPMRHRSRAFCGWAVGGFCRNVHRFGFETFRKLAEAGTKLVDDATQPLKPTWHEHHQTDFRGRRSCQILRS
ncbi:DUF269 domain-containing protein [Mesorhizobium kowhaii]|uniref:DUF269 domain-containing protein n=1 Tax=Mesorhizobium kowhaii TaxID=1300272 RepID=UPI0035EAFAD7